MDFHELEKVKNHWQSAADLMPQLLCLLNAQGRVLRANRTIERWGVGMVTSVKGWDIHDILHPRCTDPDCYFKQFWRVSEPARQAGRLFDLDAYDATLGRHLTLRFQPLVSPSKGSGATEEDLHAILIIEDICDLKMSEADIRRRNEELLSEVQQEREQRTQSEKMQARMLKIMENTSDYIAMSDVSGSMLYLNKAGRAVLGLAPDDDISHRKLCDHADLDVQRTIRQVAIPTAIEKGLWSGESRMRDHEGREIHTSQVIVAHRNGNDQVDCIFTVLRDISDRVKTEQALRESRDELRRMSSLLVSIQEDERRRIALDLHDGLGQSLSWIKLNVENVASQLEAGSHDAALDMLHKLIPRLKDVFTDVRRLATELRPSMLDDLGIVPTLKWFFREFESIVSDMIIEKELNIYEEDVPENLKITIYRVIQEATSNILKHAAASRMRVSLDLVDEGIRLSIEDNGCGFDPDGLCSQCSVCNSDECKGIGLISMKERVTLSGGVYHLNTRPGFGTRINALWPVDRQAGTRLSFI